MLIDDNYHGQQPDWRDTKTTRKGELFGIELEVIHPKNRSHTADALDDLDIGKYPAPIAERDGSLDRVKGVEIICPPLPRKETVEEGGYMDRLLSLLREAGVPDEQPGGYGMHVNVNVAEWEPKTKVLVQYLLNKFYSLGAVIGRRQTGFGSFMPRFRYTREPGGGLSLVTYPGGKHSAAWLRGGNGVTAGTGGSVVMEVRFPKSTTNLADIRNAVDFVSAVRDWVSAAPNHTEAVCFVGQHIDGVKNRVAEALFLGWCHKYRPELFALLKNSGVEPLTGKRQAVAFSAFEENENIANPWDGIRYDERTVNGNKKQILRIGALLGKGAQLTSQQDERGNILASTIKAAR
jgi:hypothetical protein